ncbi:MAG: hypothetical protein ABSF99_13265, partial [Anaerolineales bacterium]
CCVGNVTNPQVGCVWNVLLKAMRQFHGSYAMNMRKIIHTMNMVNESYWSILQDWECAGM